MISSCRPLERRILAISPWYTYFQETGEPVRVWQTMTANYCHSCSQTFVAEVENQYGTYEF